MGPPKPDVSASLARHFHKESAVNNRIIDTLALAAVGLVVLMCTYSLNHMAVGTPLANKLMFSWSIGALGFAGALALVYGLVSWFHAYREELQEGTRLDFAGTKVNGKLMEMYSTAAIASFGVAIIALFSGLWCKLGPVGYLAARDAAQLPLTVTSMILLRAGYMYWRRHSQLVRS